MSPRPSNAHRAEAPASDLRAAFADVEVWIFDLDNTLYPADARLFDQIDRRMTAFIADALDLSPAEANRVRAEYWSLYGTTLNGLIQRHGMAPEAFLEFVHDIDLTALTACARRRTALAALPGRRIVHTNGSRGHAARVLDRLGVADLFDEVFAIEDSDLIPKPQPDAYHTVVTRAAIEPRRAAFFEDTARNLAEPHRLGMRTVFTPTGCARAEADRDAPYVEHVAEDLTAFLASVIDPTDAPRPETRA